MTCEVLEDGVYVDGTRINGRYEAGYLAFAGRAPTEAKAIEEGLKVGLFVEIDDGEGGTRIVPHHNVVFVREVPRPVLVEAETDDEGNITTPAQLDPRFHFNFWLKPAAVAGGAWEAWAKAWSLAGEDVQNVNKTEEAKELSEIELIDLFTIGSRSNRI